MLTAPRPSLVWSYQASVKHVCVIKKPEFWSLLINSGFYSAFACQAVLGVLDPTVNKIVCAMKESTIQWKEAENAVMWEIREVRVLWKSRYRGSSGAFQYILVSFQVNFYNVN